MSVADARIHSFLVVLLLTGCAATARYSHDTLMFAGRVTEVENRESTVRVGQGPAIFTPAMLAFKPVTGERAHLLYTVVSGDGVTQVFRSEETFSVGSCVEAWTDKSKVNDSYWKLGEVLLRPSKSCQAAKAS